MKKVEAIIRAEAFINLREALSTRGFSGLTVSEAAGCGKQKGKQGIFRGNKFEIKLVPRIKVEMVIDDDQVEDIIDLIVEYCSTNTVGDGKIFIFPVEEVIRIRTGERGKQAVL
ncbi:P-II family nitrogen regulator [Rossellomorea marisflavi]|jgi:nitrogen regulatory protein P-II 1|uniref:P-II family nitrogen regulator n=1 Tax=Rossellomorea marisflavi TaxID=189381 RepID=A0A5D4RTV9_9BACI|nr:P-II family nitrogen regulator [Rossellomorea marisflavi]KQU60681.1 transcriptional regulator [Bacillus sp. Leaf406]MDW4526150.1 P-II family nitrogen regulator [Rossellomorea marisflavi]TYS54189.1 P-II family nitrogen regulator [Rossellomorea marisflavi]UKS66819.1 P-II family nitrogen regulator [Rossellomorea marisflavi]WJV17445.1 P-II family nitrogen regulator [Rossellomorea marisflavi]